MESLAFHEEKKEHHVAYVPGPPQPKQPDRHEEGQAAADQETTAPLPNPAEPSACWHVRHTDHMNEVRRIAPRGPKPPSNPRIRTSTWQQPDAHRLSGNRAAPIAHPDRTPLSTSGRPVRHGYARTVTRRADRSAPSGGHEDRLQPPTDTGVHTGHNGHPRRRDRHGRGIRGVLIPQHLPGYRTRATRFDQIVLDTVEDLERRWAKYLDGVEFAVEDVPPSQPSPWEIGIPLGRYFPADAGQAHRIVVYRRPIEARTRHGEDLAALVLDVVVEQVAHLLGRAPEDVDPRYGQDR